TALGVQGGLPNGWKYDLRGEYAAVSDQTVTRDETASGNAAGLALDVATSPADRVRLSTRRHTISFGEDRPASFQTHGVSWSRDGEEGRAESVGARYVEETNLYRATALGTSFFPIASRTWEVNAQYARPVQESPGVSVAMTYRHREAIVGPSGVGSEGAFIPSGPDADLSASTSLRLFPRVEVEGGMVGRYMAGGYGIGPRATLRYDLGNGAVVFVRGLHRVVESGAASSGTVLPRVASIEDNSDPASRESYAVGFERHAGSSSVRFEVSTQRMDELVRAVRQALRSPAASHTNDSDKLAISIAQDLSVVGLTPFGSDWKLLLALESARSTASSEREDPASTNRILGGLALAF